MIMVRILIVILLVVVGAAALTELNPAAQQSTNPLIRGLASVHAWFRNSPASNPLTAGKEKETRVYKWQDARGEWHFSNQPPPAGTASSVKIYRSDVNITQAPPPLAEGKSEPARSAPKQAPAIPKTAAPLLPITNPERVKQLIEDAKNVQGLVNKRQQAIDQQVEP